MTGIEPAAFRLGGEPSILLRYMDVYKIFSVGRLLQQALRRRLLYPFNYGNKCRILGLFQPFRSRRPILWTQSLSWWIIWYPFNYENIVREMYLYRITKISQNSKSYDSANFAVPCIQICPLKRRPTFGSPIRSFWAIPTWKSISLQLIVRS